MREASVTILVTVKNSVETIEKCINSILNLNYKNKKIYVTDAYSSDGTWEILKKYRRKIRLERIKGNIARAHNYMIKKCNTEFVALTDADCIVDKNWLKCLIKAFKDKDVIAAGGLVKTPKHVNKLQKLIGRELENRFKYFPKYVSRLPTMSLCIRTKYAKKILFDENLDIAQETDWGYRATKFGKIAYVPSAIVYHYHRALWKSYFKQQFNYAKFAFLLYFRKGHIKRILGDEITKLSMILQIIFLYLSTLFLIFGIFNFYFFNIFFIFVILLFSLYFIEIYKISKDANDFFWFLILFIFRNIAWCLGIIRGVFLSITY